MLVTREQSYSAKWQSRSQSPRYPCPAERETLDKGNEGSGNEIGKMAAFLKFPLLVLISRG